MLLESTISFLFITRHTRDWNNEIFLWLHIDIISYRYW